MDWDILDTALQRCLPRCDTLALALLRACVHAPVLAKGRLGERTRGLLQGSPLSPLLANLYLDQFDERMAALGYWLVRYGDDFIVLTRSEKEAARALEDATRLLAPLKLALKKEKTAITPVAAGLRFLGMEIGPALDERHVERVALRQTLFIRNDYCFVGVDHETLVVRNRGVLIAKAPFYRIASIVIFGTNTVSTRLLHACSRRKIPVSFCSPAGHYINTLRPDSRTHYERFARHHARHAALLPGARLAIAREIVVAKISNHRFWLKQQSGPDAGNLVKKCDETLRRLPAAASVEQLRGFEGQVAQQVFEHVVALITQPGFDASKRDPHNRPDRLNALLDFAYWLLFTRINVLVRGEGMNPYLGFLHSQEDHYESLVYDLMEPPGRASTAWW